MIKILLADDNGIDRTALREILKAEPDWEIIEATDGQHALDLLCDGLRPHLCLLDMHMPKLNGLELLQRLRRDLSLRELHVVITSATRDRDTVLSLAKLGIDGFLVKPYQAATLTNLRQIIGKLAIAPVAVTTTRSLLTKTVLVVEDDLVARTALCEMIRAEPGWDVVETSSGLRALERLRAGLAPDLCLVDMRMPIMDGLMLVEHMRRDIALERLRVVILSGEQDREKIMALSKLGISGYLLKPANQAKLSAVLRAAAGLPPAPVAKPPDAPSVVPPSGTKEAPPVTAPTQTPEPAPAQ